MNRPKNDLRLILASILIALTLTTAHISPVSAQDEGETLPRVTDPVMTFTVSFFIGMAGAFVYIFILLMTDRTISILRNDILPLWVMVLLFTISGGIVSGISQTSAGNGIAVNNVQTVFMVGFGWQGVISGAGGSSKVAELKEKEKEMEENENDLKSLLDDVT